MGKDNNVLPAQAVTRRALCLAALCYRGHIEASLAGRNVPVRHGGRELKCGIGMVVRINNWLASERLRDALSADEKRFLDARLGDVGPPEVINATWRTEALAVLLWAFRLAEDIPPYDTKCHLDSALERISFLKDTRAIVADARLRSLVELQDARRIAELWHWRARTYQMAHEPDRHRRPTDKSEEEFVRAAATSAKHDGRFATINGDFSVFGKPYREATEEEWQLLLSIARERHYGLNWLTGIGEDWDEVLTDT